MIDCLWFDLGGMVGNGGVVIHVPFTHACTPGGGDDGGGEDGGGDEGDVVLVVVPGCCEGGGLPGEEDPPRAFPTGAVVGVVSCALAACLSASSRLSSSMIACR
jgi:hypothetical protein